MTTAVSRPYLRCALGLLLTPALVGACFGEYVALVGVIEQFNGSNAPEMNYLVVFSMLFILPILFGMVGWVYFLPPAVLLAFIGIALRGHRTIYPIVILVISGGLLAAGWSWMIDTIFTESRDYAWSNFLWIYPELRYGGPAVFGCLATLAMALFALPHYPQERVG